jgi:hypothetical protein
VEAEAKRLYWMEIISADALGCWRQSEIMKFLVSHSTPSGCGNQITIWATHTPSFQEGVTALFCFNNRWIVALTIAMVQVYPYYKAPHKQKTILPKQPKIVISPLFKKSLLLNTYNLKPKTQRKTYYVLRITKNSLLLHWNLVQPATDQLLNNFPLLRDQISTNAFTQPRLP